MLYSQTPTEKVQTCHAFYDIPSCTWWLQYLMTTVSTMSPSTCNTLELIKSMQLLNVIFQWNVHGYFVLYMYKIMIVQLLNH